MEIECVEEAHKNLKIEETLRNKNEGVMCW